MTTLADFVSSFKIRVVLVKLWCRMTSNPEVLRALSALALRATRSTCPRLPSKVSQSTISCRRNVMRSFSSTSICTVRLAWSPDGGLAHLPSMRKSFQTSREGRRNGSVETHSVLALLYCVLLSIFFFYVFFLFAVPCLTLVLNKIIGPWLVLDVVFGKTEYPQMVDKVVIITQSLKKKHRPTRSVLVVQY